MVRTTGEGRSVRRMVLIAVVAALCFLALYIQIPVGPMFVHAGNLLVVTAALLLGGWQAGLAGALGMGLWDLLNGYAATLPVTLILKFLIGLTVGMVFRALLKGGRFPRGPVAGIGGLFLAGGAAVLLYGQLRWGVLSAKMVALAVFCLAAGVLLVLLALLGRRFQAVPLCATLAAVCGMAVNLVGETLNKLITYLLAGSDFSAAVTMAVFAQASTVINAVLAIVGGVALYLPLKKALRSLD